MEISRMAFYLFLATVCLEITTSFKPYQDTPEEVKQQEKKIKYSATSTGKDLPHPLIIEYCQTCSYRGRVNEIRSALSDIYPRAQVIEEGYPLAFHWTLISNLLSYLRIAGIALLFAGDHIFAYLQMNYPPWYLQIKNNKLHFGIFLFFGVNIISNWMVSTGAFEVIYNGVTLYSGLKTGSLPSVEEIIIMLNELAS